MLGLKVRIVISVLSTRCYCGSLASYLTDLPVNYEKMYSDLNLLGYRQISALSGMDPRVQCRINHDADWSPGRPKDYATQSQAEHTV